ncbi:sulfite exporter TauE/SafE family protein [Roseobacter sinensis]|uniref:Probable membrane transporter protein n=1 Tax=Roseobacter sinensis TaxID=2931391 RepID=A0ABT3BHJ8_9RHOB|nr:sulfite exporter TauE/SafE family protein [Roseobacter sp. WL0113]MCV3273057.1 sulfite exporter TauE/SafE family protein [Roseobacter sp. WL0113]
MTGYEIFYLVIGAIAGGFINGLAGFGTSLFALGFFLTIMPAVEAVAITVVISVVSGLQGLWIVRHAIAQNPRRLARFLLPATFGIPLGIASLKQIDVSMLKLLIAFFLILYGGFFTLRRTLPRIDRPTPVIDCTVGFFSGVLGGAASLSGALPTMWCSMRAWPRYETRAVLQPFNVTVLGLTAAMLAWNGAYHAQTLLHICVALPTALVAAQVGIAVFKRLDDAVFRRLLIAVCFLSGTVLLLREVL